MEIKQFSSFAEAKSSWETLASHAFHYPFQSWWYQNLFAQHFSSEQDIFVLGIYENAELLAIGAFEVVESIVRFLGTKNVSQDKALTQDITDFGDLLYSDTGKEKAQEVWDTIHAFFTTKGFTTIQLDYVRQDSSTYTLFATRGTTISQQETSPFITLPATWEEYLATLDKKERHELKRKMNRLESKTTFRTALEEPTTAAFSDFIRLHKLSSADKAAFMTESMEMFFTDLTIQDTTDWKIKFYSLCIDEKKVATLLAFTNATHVLLYNSGFDPEYSYYSVGLLVSALFIKESITDGKNIFDFLRGNERYKYNLGAKDLPLYQILASISA